MLKRGSISLLWFCAQIVWQVPSILLAFDLAREGGGLGSDGSVQITSDRMTVRHAEDQVRFEGHVSIWKGGLHLEAERATLFLAPDSADAPSKSGGMTRIELQGDVRIQQGEQHARAQHGVYDRGKEEIVLTGEPVAWERDYRVKGEKITFSMAEKRTRVERSEVTIQTGNTEQRGAQKREADR